MGFASWPSLTCLCLAKVTTTARHGDRRDRAARPSGHAALRLGHGARGEDRPRVGLAAARRHVQRLAQAQRARGALDVSGGSRQ
eukprot:scaffold80866_cov24-Phaeocystis_antarctica.AAC.1